MLVCSYKGEIMSLPVIISLSIILISLILYMVGFLKKIFTMSKTSSAFLLPSIEVISITLLLNYLPDSYHILTTSIISLSMVSFSEILFLFQKNTPLRILTRIIFIASQLIWGEIFKSAFYIYRVPYWLSITLISIYFVITIFVLIVTGKQKFSVYLSSIIALAISFFVNYCTFISFIYEQNLYSILQFSGTALTCTVIILYILHYSRFDFKYKNTLFLTLTVLSQSLISAGNILMIK